MMVANSVLFWIEIFCDELFIALGAISKLAVNLVHIQAAIAIKILSQPYVLIIRQHSN